MTGEEERMQALAERAEHWKREAERWQCVAEQLERRLVAVTGCGIDDPERPARMAAIGKECRELIKNNIEDNH